MIGGAHEPHRALASPCSSLVAAVGCSADPAQPYIGHLVVRLGHRQRQLPQRHHGRRQLHGNVTIKTASDGGLLVLDPEGCNFTYALDGSRASASAQTCSFAVPELGAGVTAAVTYDTITLATNDGKTMDDTFSGTVVYTSSAGALDCVFSGTATLTKVSDQ